MLGLLEWTLVSCDNEYISTLRLLLLHLRSVSCYIEIFWTSLLNCIRFFLCRLLSLLYHLQNLLVFVIKVVEYVQRRVNLTKRLYRWLIHGLVWPRCEVDRLREMARLFPSRDRFIKIGGMIHLNCLLVLIELAWLLLDLLKFVL